MKLTKRLLSYLNKVFDKDPYKYLALSFVYTSDMQWVISDGFLTTTVTANPQANLNIDLSQYTLQSLTSYIAEQSGYSVTFFEQFSQGGTSALTLIDGAGDMSTGLYAYTSPLWSYLDANATELQIAETQIANLPAQMSTTTAQADWLDYLGTFYGVPRNAGELDQSYGPRIISTVLRSASNNIALEMAISTFTGQSTKVTNVVEYGFIGNGYDGKIKHDGSKLYDTEAGVRYCLFDVQYGYDLLNGGDITNFETVVVSIINTLRAAGTYLRSIDLIGTILNDSLNPPSDGDGALALLVNADFIDALNTPMDSASTMPISLANFSDTLTAPIDVENLEITYNYTYSGLRTYNGVIEHLGGETLLELP